MSEPVDVSEIEQRLRAAPGMTGALHFMRNGKGGYELFYEKQGDPCTCFGCMGTIDAIQLLAHAPTDIRTLLDALSSERAAHDETRRERDEARAEIDRREMRSGVVSDASWYKPPGSPAPDSSEMDEMDRCWRRCCVMGEYGDALDHEPFVRLWPIIRGR